MFKKIYIEIINYCNLSCSFCLKTTKPKKMISIEEFSLIINQIKNYTNYIYLHIQGEPLLHPNILTFLDISYQNNLKVNITTNGTVINQEVLLHKAVNQINFSIQALVDLENKYSLYNQIIYLTKIKNHPIINIRFWATLNNQDYDYFKNQINSQKVFFDIKDKFYWPIINTKENTNKTICPSYKNHIGILADGEVVCCCLDISGHTSIGNIYKTNLVDILNSNKYLNFIKNSQNKKLTFDLCKSCFYRK